jgi:hypothetical protein
MSDTINSPGSSAGPIETALPIQATRSGNYTVSSTDIANGWSLPIELLWPAGFPDQNYTVAVSVEQILGIKAPKALWHLEQFTKLVDTGNGNGRSQGIVVVVAVDTNGKAGDIFVVHAIAVHD